MRVAVGIDLGGTNMRAALVSEDGRIISSEREKTPISRGPEAAVADMAKMVKKMVNENPSVKVEGIGIGSPGPLNRESKTLFEIVNLPGFAGFQIGTRVQEATGLRTELDNDAKSAAYGEGAFGSARGLKHYILMTFGTGIGGGVVINGNMLYGKNDGAGEIGHVTLHPGGHLCPCGNRGCFEQYASATAIERRSVETFGKAIPTRELFRLQEAGDKKIDDFLRAVALDIAIATASLINLFEPESVIFGGGIFTEGGGPLTGWVSEVIKDRCFKTSQKNLQIMPSSLAGNAGVLGAASLIFRTQKT